jgi:hypothetical protein
MQRIIKYLNEKGQTCILKIHANGTYEKIVEAEKTDEERILSYKEIYRADSLSRLCSEVCARTINYKKL